MNYFSHIFRLIIITTKLNSYFYQSFIFAPNEGYNYL